jgi:hypothetical protein
MDQEEVVNGGTSSCLHSRMLLGASLLATDCHRSWIECVSHFLEMLPWVWQNYHLPILLCRFVYPDCRNEIEVALAHH